MFHARLETLNEMVEREISADMIDLMPRAPLGSVLTLRQAHGTQNIGPLPKCSPNGIRSCWLVSDCHRYSVPLLAMGRGDG